MKIKYIASVLSLHISLILVACSPTQSPISQPTLTPKPEVIPISSGVPTSPMPDPSSSSQLGAPTTPASTANPASGSSTTVTLPNGSKLVISLGNRYLEAKGQTIQLQTHLVDAAGQPLPLNTLKLLFSSSRPQDISVTDLGLITALVDQGFADITVMIEGTDLKASQLVSVNEIGLASGGGGGGGGGSVQPSPSPMEDLNVDIEFEGLGIGEFQVNTYTSQSQNQASVAMDHDGDFVVTWSSDGQDGDYGGIYAQRYSSTGLTLGSEFRVNDYVTGTQDNPVVELDQDGDFVIAWNGYTQFDSQLFIFAKRFNSQGVALGSEFQVNISSSEAQVRPSIAMDLDGDFVVAWTGSDTSLNGVFARRYNSAGNALGSEFQINTFQTSRQDEAEVAMDNDGDFVVTWTSHSQDGSVYGVYARRYNSLGTALDASEFRVNSTTGNSQLYSDIAMDPDGDFVICWQSNYQDNSNYSVFAQRYNSAGLALGSEFRVNTVTEDNQQRPVISMDEEGDFVIVWESNLQDQDGYGIYAQRFNSVGVTIGSEFKVNTYTQDSQSLPFVSMNQTGQFIISWASNLQDGDETGVYAKRYSTSGQVQ